MSRTLAIKSYQTIIRILRSMEQAGCDQGQPCDQLHEQRRRQWEKLTEVERTHMRFWEDALRRGEDV